MPVTQSTKDKIVVRFYAVGTSPVDAFVNGFTFANQADAVFESMATGSNVYTAVKEFALEEIKDITPVK
jgi:hypothetical protein